MMPNALAQSTIINQPWTLTTITTTTIRITHTHTQRAQVPFLIFSAGIADVIEEVCRQQLHHPLPPNVHIVSNRMLFEGEENGGGDKLTGFTEPVFHVFNKRCGLCE